MPRSISRVGFLKGLSDFLVDGHFLPVSSCGHPSLCGCVLMSCYKDTGQNGLGPTLITSFSLLFKNFFLFKNSIYIMIFSPIIAGLQCSVSFLLYSMLTHFQLNFHFKDSWSSRRGSVVNESD